MPGSLQRRAAPSQISLTLKESSRFWLPAELTKGASFCFLLLENLTHPTGLPGPHHPRPSHACTKRSDAHILGWYLGDTAVLSPTAARGKTAAIAHIPLSLSCSLPTSSFRSDSLHKPQMTGNNRNAELLSTQENVAHWHKFAISGTDRWAVGPVIWNHQRNHFPSPAPHRRPLENRYF